MFVHDSQVKLLVQLKQLVVHTRIRACATELHLEKRRHVSGSGASSFGAELVIRVSLVKVKSAYKPSGTSGRSLSWFK